MTPTLPLNVASIDWQWAPFAALSRDDVYAILALRQDVFVLEQQSLFRDIDGVDQQADHLLGWHGANTQRKLVAYLRCVPPDAHGWVALQRVLCARSTRGTGLGKQLFSAGLANARQRYPTHAIRISAQQYLENFYAGFGFVTCSAPYLEDGIWHCEMVCAAAKN